MFQQMKYGPNGYEPIKPDPPHDPDRKVGYKSPPIRTRWKKGQSGNPKGRKKRAVVTDLRKLLDDVFEEPTRIPKGGRLRTVSTLEAVLLAYFNSGVRANPRMVRRLFTLAHRIGMVSRHDRTKDYPPTLIIPHDDDDEKILRMHRKEKAARANNAEHDDSDQTETPASQKGDA